MMKLAQLITTLVILLTFSFLQAQTINYRMPEEIEAHEGTWLQWPHHYTYGTLYRNSLDQTWIEMTAALQEGENVHIVAYNNTEKDRIEDLLNAASISLANIDFYIHQNDDVWIRDNGPMYVYNTNDELVILDWGFNGWGNDAPYDLCDLIPEQLATDQNMSSIDLSAMVLEGGAIEHDGRGTMMTTRSSITHASRNPGLTENQIENYLTENMGIEKFIWLDGLYGGEITDMHIDGVMKYANSNTIVTMSQADLLYWGLTQSDINILMSASNLQGNPYNFIEIPLTQNDVSTEFGTNLGYKGCYANYYIANDVILVPNYNDPNDILANNAIQTVYPNRTVVGIDVRNLYENGGMVHCVTQQQPVATPISTKINQAEKERRLKCSSFPNPFREDCILELNIPQDEDVSIEIFSLMGEKIYTRNTVRLSSGQNMLKINGAAWVKGTYICTIKTANTPNLIFKQLLTKH